MTIYLDKGGIVIIVFGVIILFILAVGAWKYIVNRSNKDINEMINKSDEVFNEGVKVCETIDLNKEYELVAVIMGALSAHTGKNVEQLNIRSIKRVNNGLSWREASMK